MVQPIGAAEGGRFLVKEVSGLSVKAEPLGSTQEQQWEAGSTVNGSISLVFHKSSKVNANNLP